MMTITTRSLSEPERRGGGPSKLARNAAIESANVTACDPFAAPVLEGQAVAFGMTIAIQRDGVISEPPGAYHLQDIGIP